MAAVASDTRALRGGWWTRRRRSVAGGLTALLVIVSIVVAAAFPWGVLKPMVEQRLTRRFGRTVTIASMERVDSFGFTPTILLRGIRIPQPAWAGTGDLARVGEARISFPTLALLGGRFLPRAMTLSKVRLALVRTAEGRTNWGETSKRRGKGGKVLNALTIADAVVSYRDAERERAIVVRVSSDAQAGFRIAGRGTIGGVSVAVRASGPSIVGVHEGRWPFTATIDGASLAMAATGVMDNPLDTDAMTMDVTAKADDLKLIDAVIEAGLFRTQPVTLAAHVRRDDDHWAIGRLRGTIGRSAFTGSVDVARRDGRTRLHGDIHATQFDFADLSSDEGRAKGAALERAIGLRLVPNTRINLAHIGKMDGVLRYRADRIISRKGASSITAMHGTFAIDHQLLTAYPLTLVLQKGAITGRATVDQRRGRTVPIVTLDLALRDSSIPALGGGDGDISGRVDGHLRVAGAGDTIREAIGASGGTLGIVARAGTLPAKIAAALGFDAGRALVAGRDDRAGLRCFVLRARLRRGRGAIDPMILDTTQSQMRGEGTISFPSEALAIRMTGAPKHGSILRLPGAAMMTGTIREPNLVVPEQVKSIGNIFKAIGRAIKGTQGPTATDADCDALARIALG